MNKTTMTREDLIDNVTQDQATIEAQHEALGKLIDASAAVKRGGDVTFAAIDAAKEVVDGYTETRESVVHVRTTLKKRAMARMSEE